MTKYEGIEKTVISQGDNLRIDVALKGDEVYLNWDVADFAQKLADLTGKAVEVSITQIVQLKPKSETPA